MFTFLLAFLPFLAETVAAAPSGLTAQQWGLIGLALSTASAFVYGFVQKKRGTRDANLAKAGFAGLKVALADLALHKGAVTTIEDAIYAAAKDLNVPEEHVDAHIGDGLPSAGSPKPPA